MERAAFSLSLLTVSITAYAFYSTTHPAVKPEHVWPYLSLHSSTRIRVTLGYSSYISNSNTLKHSYHTRVTCWIAVFLYIAVKAGRRKERR